MTRFRYLAAFVLTVLAATPAAAQIVPCSTNELAPANLPPADSKPLYRCLQLVFHPENAPVIEADTYIYHLKAKYSLMSKKEWVPYDEQAILSDFNNLWRTGFLDNLWIEVVDEPYTNGVMGKHVIFHMEERARVKIVDYKGLTSDVKLKVEPSKIEEKLKEKGIEIRLDSFVDQAIIRRVQGVIKELYGEKGYQSAVVTPERVEMGGGPKLLHLTFRIFEGPHYQIKQVVIDGNKAVSDGTLIGKMKDNKPRNWLSFVTEAGTYQEAKFADDAEKMIEYYKSQGYVRARVGSPQVELLDVEGGGKTQWIRLRIPVDEGQRYRVGKVEITGNKAVTTEYLRSVFPIKPGEYYDESKIKKGYQKASEGYGSIGYFEFSPNPDFTFPCRDENFKPTCPEPIPPIVNLSLGMNEGKQFFVNRVTFTGNTTTHDNVIRREIRLYEGGVFNTESLKYSVRRLNQLGYFKPLERSEDIQVVPTPGVDNKVDVKLNFTEQNRNQISFGAGVSQFDGFFGQLSFQTSNFLGRGETVGISLQKGSQAKNYQLSFSEPYLFDRPITAGIDIYSRQFIYLGQFTQQATGGNVMTGLPIRDFLRLYLGYNYERVRVFDIAPAYQNPAVLAASPYLRDELLINQGGRRRVSKVSPSLVYNTVNQPLFPTEGKQLTAAFDIAGAGGDTYYTSVRLEEIWYFPLTRRTSLGVRTQGQYISPYGQTTTLPIFEKLFLGGEYSIRGFDLRSVGPRDPASRVVIGGNKTLLFNAEYMINVGGPVRLVFFYDAGQVRDLGERFGWREPVTEVVPVETSPLSDPTNQVSLVSAAPPKVITVGSTTSFKTSTGMEVRFLMPVLNVPFRLIMAYNPQRTGVLTNNFLIQKKFVFRFAVGTTF